jgi:hypothetical protein
MPHDGEQQRMPLGEAPGLVSEYLDEHPEYTSEQFEQKARTLARKCEREWPINRQPATLAAASIYLSGLLVNEKLTQREIAAVAPVGTAAIREGYIEICEHMDGISHPRQQSQASGETTAGRQSRFINRARNWVSSRVRP